MSSKTLYNLLLTRTTISSDRRTCKWKNQSLGVRGAIAQVLRQKTMV